VRVKAAVLTDFDGTISRTDVGEAILQEYAPVEWKEVADLYRSRKTGNRDSVARQLVSLRTREEQIFAEAIQRGLPDTLRLVDRVAKLDETFREFVSFCQRNELLLEIVSDGLDLYIGHLLQKWNLDLPVRTNHAVVDRGRVQIEYPWADATCTLCRTCKLLRLFQLRTEGYRIAYVGDGATDLCPAVEADLVFAKDELARLCREEDIEFIPFERFSDVQRELEGWL
jgi:2-hydroxy-3-keto-5-methylthiopentenyl-1-phosphate phosphatase